MDIGVIGAGGVASAFARHAVKSGHRVTVSNSRGPDSLGSLVSELGSNSSAGTVIDAAAKQIVLVAVPWSKIPAALSTVTDWSGKVVIDANNPIEAPDFKPAELNGKLSTEVFTELVPGASVVKAFNTLPVPILSQDAKTSGGQRVIFFSGDDASAKSMVAELIDSFGFFGVDLGSLSVGGLLQQFPGGPLPALNLIKL